MATFNDLFKRYKKSRGHKMIKINPDQDPSVNQEVDNFFNDHPEELLEDGSRPHVLLLAPDDGSFIGFLWNTIWMFTVFTIATVLTQSVYDILGMFTTQRLTIDLIKFHFQFLLLLAPPGLGPGIRQASQDLWLPEADRIRQKPY